MAEGPDLVPVTLDALVMDDTPDANGVRWRVLRDGMPGYASPVVDSRGIPLTGRHGTSRPFGNYRSRDLALRGRAKAPTFASAWDAYYRLLEVVSLGRQFPFVVGEPTPKQLLVELAGDDPELSEPVGDDSYGWRFTFQVPLTAPYPFKRAVAATTVAVASGATVTHTAAGRAAAEIEVTCTSTGTVDLTIGGLRLRTGSLNAGTKLTSGPGFTNPRRTIISSTGVNLFRLIVQPMQWPAMSPAGNSIHQAGTADLSIRYFPTYP
jgi:hypothetical protein